MGQPTVPNSAAGSADDVLANQNYIDGLQGKDPGYDPSGMKEAIEELSMEIKRAQGNGADVMFMTSELLGLMSGYGGARVGADGEAQSALTKSQGFLSKAWDLIKEAGKNSNGNPDPNSTNNFYKYITKANSILKKELHDGRITKSQYDSIHGALNTVEQDVIQFPANYKAAIAKDPSLYPPSVQAGMNKFLNATPPDILGAMYYISSPHSYVEGGVTKHFLGDPQYLQSLNSDMTSANQQVTGASQVMATIAKTDSKTNQAEETGYNNFLQMIKKTNAYLVQLQRTQ